MCTRSLRDGTLVVSGTASGSGGYGAWVNVSLTTSCGPNGSFTPEYKVAPMSENFDLTVAVTDADTSVSFSSSITGDDLAGTRTLRVARTRNRP